MFHDTVNLTVRNKFDIVNLKPVKSFSEFTTLVIFLNIPVIYFKIRLPKGDIHTS